MKRVHWKFRVNLYAEAIRRLSALIKSGAEGSAQLRHHFRGPRTMMRRRRPEQRVPRLSSDREAASTRAEPSVTVHILRRFLASLCLGHNACRYAANAQNPRIRDCNKTTDVRTSDSRTGIVPRPLAALLSRSLSFFEALSLFSLPPCLYFSLSRSLFLPLSSFLGPPRPFCSPLALPLSTDVRGLSTDRSSTHHLPLCLILPLSPSLFFPLSRRFSISFLSIHGSLCHWGRKNATPFPLEKWKLPELPAGPPHANFRPRFVMRECLIRV